MATTYAEEQKKKQQETLQAQQNGLSGVSENTRTQLSKYQAGYQPNDQAQAAQQNLQNVQMQKPQTYNSKYGAQLDTILQEIQNPGAFKYDMNGDALFNSYKDLVTEQARQGALNAQGMATGLTGGYGNSYALSAGAQAYQQALLPLYERIPEFANLARQNYDQDISNRYRALGALQDAENMDYNRHRDTVADWRDDVAMAQDAYRDERDFGYSDYLNSLNYWNNQAAAENADMRADQDEEFRQAQLAEQIRGTDLDENFRQAQLAEQIRGTNLDNDYRNRTLAETIRQNNLDEDYRNRTFDETVRQNDLDNDYRNRTFEETVRQNNLDNDYRNRTFDETVRQNDLDNDYRNRTLDWNMATDQRNFEAQQYWNNEESRMNWANLEEKQRQFDAELTEEQRQYNQKVAMTYASSILANGQMPSMELLIAAGLSYEDAQSLMAMITTGGGGTPTTTPTQKGSSAEIAKDTGSTVKDIYKDMIYAGGNGIAGALSNFNGTGDMANIYTDMAVTGTDAAGNKLSAADRQLAAQTATEMYNMSQMGKSNDANVDAYIRSLIVNGTMGTNKEAMDELMEKQKKLKAMGLTN